MYILPILLPFLLLSICGLSGRKIGVRGTFLLVISILSLSFLISLLLFYEVFTTATPVTLPLLEWLSSDFFQLQWTLFYDDLSITMLIVVHSVSLIVLLYTYDYMISDPHIIRFYFFILLFVASMILLITTTSLPILFIGWEGIGLASFLLISFWFTRIETSLGAILAILMNRVGDLFFLLGIFFSFFLFGSVDIITLLSSNGINTDLLLLPFFIAAMAKSAQLFLHVWLPYSMEGPTPISALLHAATLVTAGVFLLLRLSLLLSFSYYSLIIITIIGSLTTFVGASLAFTSLDMKELIAYSTMSQLGYMVTIMGLKYFNLSFFHLLFHAYFKALLFLTAGSIIHTFFDLQDLRKTGASIRFLPFSYAICLLGFSSLSGLPFTTGFYSKEAIINSSYYSLTFLSQMVYLVTITTAFLTIAYSFKFLGNVFFSTTRLSLFLLQNVHYYSYHLTLSLFLIGILTIFLGFFYSKMVYLSNLPIAFFNLYLPLWVKILPILFFLLLFFFFYSFPIPSSITSKILQNQYYFKTLYQTIAGSFLALGYRIFSKIMDYGFLDLLSPLTGSQFSLLSKKMSISVTTPYLFSFFFFFTFLFLLLL